MVDSGRGAAEQKTLKRHLSRVIYHQVYCYTQIKFKGREERLPGRCTIGGTSPHQTSSLALAAPALSDSNKRKSTRMVDVRLPGKWNSNSHGARPAHRIISMKKWIRTSRLSIKNFLYFCPSNVVARPSSACGLGLGVWGSGCRV